MKKIHDAPAGDQVACDCCGEEWTHRTETGGFLFLTKDYCPDCARNSLPSIRSYGEEKYIRAWCPKDLSFADWVRRLRYASGDDRVQIFVNE